MYTSNPRRVGIYNSYTWASRWASIHMGSIYTNTPRSLNYRHSGVQDWTTKKPTPPHSLNNRRSGVQDWTTRKYTQGKYPPQPQLATCYDEARAKLQECRGG